MKTPVKIYTHFQDSHYIGHMGFWSIDMATDGKVEFIRRDVALTAINDALFIGDYETIGKAESILNEAIEDADKD